jgi:hypothetical protein
MLMYSVAALLMLVNIVTVKVMAQTEIQAKVDIQKRGYDIAVEYDRRDLGFADFTADLTMILVNAEGQRSERILRARTLEMEKDGESERRLLVFDKPADLKGTVMLTASNKQRKDQQWLYLPALKKVKRINSRTRTGPFMGSEFSYEDLGSPEVAKYDYRYLRDEACLDTQCFVLERYPKDEDSGYSKHVLWVDKDHYRLLRVDYYDRKKELLKVLTIKGYRRYATHYWRAGEMLMVNRQTQKSTTLIWENYAFKVGLSPADFQPATLSRLR